jgi:integrase
MIMVKSKPAAGRSTDLERIQEKVLEKCRAEGMHDDRLTMMSRIFVMLREECGVRKAAELAHDDMLDRFDRAIAEFSVSYRRALNVTLRAILRRASKMGLIRSLPDFTPISHQIPDDRRSSAPPAADVGRLLDHLESQADTWRGRRLHALTSAVVLAGLPVGQVLRLEVKDIDLAGRTIWLPERLWMGTTLPPVPVRMSAELYGILAGWIRRTKSAWAFPNVDRTRPWLQGRKGQPIDALRELQVACAVAGVGLMTFESLRRFHAENVRFDRPPRRVESATSDPSAARDPTSRPAVELGNPGEPAFIRGKRKKPLTPTQYEPIRILLEEWPDGLSKKAMNARFGGKESWRIILMRLRRLDPDWESAIGFPTKGYPGKESNLYRIKPW